MTRLRLRTVDAFTDQPFEGNPAAVVMLDEALPDDWMAAVARERTCLTRDSSFARAHPLRTSGCVGSPRGRLRLTCAATRRSPPRIACSKTASPIRFGSLPAAES